MTDPFLHGLLDTFLLLVLAGSLAVELVREISERLLGTERPSVIVHVLQLDVGSEACLLAEIAERPAVHVLPASPRLIFLAVKNNNTTLMLYKNSKKIQKFYFIKILRITMKVNDESSEAHCKRSPICFVLDGVVPGGQQMQML